MLTPVLKMHKLTTGKRCSKVVWHWFRSEVVESYCYFRVVEIFRGVVRISLIPFSIVFSHILM